VAPIGPSGIAFLGDAGLFASVGQKRISQLTDDGTVHATVEFAAGEQSVTLHGYAPGMVMASANGGAIDDLSYDAASQLFKVAVYPDTTPSSVNVTLTLNLAPVRGLLGRVRSS